jgi:hypothetical protein
VVPITLLLLLLLLVVVVVLLAPMAASAQSGEQALPASVLLLLLGLLAPSSSAPCPPAVGSAGGAGAAALAFAAKLDLLNGLGNLSTTWAPEQQSEWGRAAVGAMRISRRIASRPSKHHNMNHALSPSYLNEEPTSKAAGRTVPAACAALLDCAGLSSGSKNSSNVCKCI